MISNRWIALRKENWSRLEILVQQVETGSLKALSPAELREFGLLYRQSAADLSAVRADEGSRTLEAYLNRLVSRAHNYISLGQKAGCRQRMAVSCQRLSQNLPPPAALYGRRSRPVSRRGVAGNAPDDCATPVHACHARPRDGRQDRTSPMWTDSILTAKPQESSRIMTDNIGVCSFTYAGGILAGLGTIFLMFSNGMSMGVITTACRQHHMSLSIWSFVAAHGALELPSIFISGGAGLRLASGLLFPGMLRRRDALALAGAESVRLLSGTIPMLTIAGLLEAFLSPSGAPVALKFAIGAVLLTGLGFWLSEGGRERSSAGLTAATLSSKAAPGPSPQDIC